MKSSTSVHRLSTDFLAKLPDVVSAFAYGSGVFLQPQLYQSQQEKPLLDFILAVKDPLTWHQENLVANPKHYSGLASFGSNWIDFISNKIGIGLHFNTFVPFQDKVLKYGVLSIEKLKIDLKTWESLYISGRLHKPVYWIKESDELSNELESNLEAALAAALIFCQPSIHKKDLYRLICELSYRGDIRMKFAEDQQKTKRIVEGNYFNFERLYSRLLNGSVAESVELQSVLNDHLHFNTKNKLRLLSFLPQSIQSELPQSGSGSGPLETELGRVLSARVARSSRRQALAGLFGIGLGKSWKYLYRKLEKAMSSSVLS